MTWKLLPGSEVHMLRVGTSVGYVVRPVDTDYWVAFTERETAGPFIAEHFAKSWVESKVQP